jgi:hypothetical protein
MRVFRPQRGQPLTGMAMLMMLRDMQPGITVHGFRSTFKDWRLSAPLFGSRSLTRSLKVEAAYRRTELLEK